MFQNEAPNLFYNENMTIDIEIASYLVGVCLFMLVKMKCSSGWIEVKLVCTGVESI